MKEWGLRRSDFPDEVYPIWPDFADSWRVFVALQGQWVWAPFGGPVAFNLTAVKDALWLEGVKKKRRRQVRLDLREMESVALSVINKGKGKRKK